MFAFILTIILGLFTLGSVVGILVATEKAGPAIATVVGLLLTLATLGFSTVYTNDEGQAKVLLSWTGAVQGQVVSPGMGTKAPWQKAINYDIRNQQVIFASSSSEKDDKSDGPQITVQDKEGVTANIDITVRYSVKPDAVTDIYKRYGDQDSFVAKFIENDIRAAVRTVPTTFNTLELLNNRAEAEKAITAYLEERWDAHGVQVESVSLQEIRYSDEVKARFDAAQAARIEIEKAQAELEATEVSAQQKIVQAEAEAKANDVLTKSLTAEVLSQRYLDTLQQVGKDGNLVVVPEGFNGILDLKR